MSTTLNVCTHLFDEVRHSHEVRRLLAGSAFASLLTVEEDGGSVVALFAIGPVGCSRSVGS